MRLLHMNEFWGTKWHELHAPTRVGNNRGHVTYVMLRFWWIPCAGCITGVVRGDPPVWGGKFLLEEMKRKKNKWILGGGKRCSGVSDQVPDVSFLPVVVTVMSDAENSWERNVSHEREQALL